MAHQDTVQANFLRNGIWTESEIPLEYSLLLDFLLPRMAAPSPSHRLLPERQSGPSSNGISHRQDRARYWSASCENFVRVIGRNDQVFGRNDQVVGRNDQVTGRTLQGPREERPGHTEERQGHKEERPGYGEERPGHGEQCVTASWGTHHHSEYSYSYYIINIFSMSRVSSEFVWNLVYISWIYWEFT